MNFKEYQEQAARTNGSNLTAHFLGMCGEAGEVVELYKKWFAHGHDLDLVKLEKELGDVLWYISAIATELGLHLEFIAEYNIAKLKARYPDKFSSERSINRVENQETSDNEAQVFAEYAAKGYEVLKPFEGGGYAIKDPDGQMIWANLSWFRLLELRKALVYAKDKA